MAGRASHNRSRSNGGSWGETGASTRPSLASENRQRSIPNANADNEQADPYAALELTPAATDEEVRAAYKKLALKWHPDRQGGDNEKFKALTAAYALLGDPAQRKKFDTPAVENHDQPGGGGVVDVSALGTFDSAVAAVFSNSVRGECWTLKAPKMPTLLLMYHIRPLKSHKLGVSIKTTVSGAVLESAASGDVAVRSLIFGKVAGDRVDRGDAHFFELYVTPEQAAAGVVVRCASHGGSKFKLLKFDVDPSGGRGLELSATEDCRDDRGNRGTMAGFFFLGFDTASVDPPPPPGQSNEELDTLLFRRLDGLKHRPQGLSSISPGRHVFAVYGDNWIKQCKFHLTAVCVKQLPPGCPDRVRQVESLLWAKRAELAAFEEEYREAARRFRSATERYDVESRQLEDLLKQRMDAYDALGGNLVGRRHERSATGSRMRSIDFDEEDLMGGLEGFASPPPAAVSAPQRGRGLRDSKSMERGRSPPGWCGGSSSTPASLIGERLSAVFCGAPVKSDLPLDAGVPTVQEESEDRQGSNGATASRRADGVGGSGIPGCFGGAGTGKSPSRRRTVLDDSSLPPTGRGAGQRSVSSTGVATVSVSGSGSGSPPRTTDYVSQGHVAMSQGRRSVEVLVGGVRGPGSGNARTQSQSDAPPPPGAGAGGGGWAPGQGPGARGAGGSWVPPPGAAASAVAPPQSDAAAPSAARPPLSRASGGAGVQVPGGPFRAAKAPSAVGNDGQQGCSSASDVADAYGGRNGSGGAASKASGDRSASPGAPRAFESFGRGSSGFRDFTLELYDSESDAASLDDDETDAGFEIKFGARMSSAAEGPSASGTPQMERRRGSGSEGQARNWGGEQQQQQQQQQEEQQQPPKQLQQPPPAHLPPQNMGQRSAPGPVSAPFQLLHSYEEARPHRQTPPPGVQQQQQQQFQLRTPSPGPTPPLSAFRESPEDSNKKRLPGHGLRKWVGRRLGTVPPKQQQPSRV